MPNLPIINTHFDELAALAKQRNQHLVDDYQNYIEPLDSNAVANLMEAVTLSDFVFRAFEQQPESIVQLFTERDFTDSHVPDYEEQLANLLRDCDSEASLHRVLRQFRQQAMVDIAVSDMVGYADLDVSLARLTKLADALILSALNWLTLFCQERWGVPYGVDGQQQTLLVYGMGKLGGGELNFSSDIDLIFTYPQTGETRGARKSLDNQTFFTRLGQKLIAALDQQTADGFVYRVDMRLRPFGDSGPLVLSFSALEDYYQDQGRDWERYAMLKARPIGQGEHHQELSQLLRPFVYRRYIDFSVIESLRKMKLMISREVRRKQLTNNIKLGAGGIREVEFIVQVFQLIRGGRVKELQQRNLLTVLPLLVEHQIVPPESARVLTNAYRFLRRVENVIQALDDQQTQTLPDSELDQARLLHVLGIDTWQEFLTRLNAHLGYVHDEFNQLIGEEAPNHEDIEAQWQTLWHDSWHDTDDFTWQKAIASNWQKDGIWQMLYEFKQELEKQPIGQRGRVVLDKLMPRVLFHLHSNSAFENAYENAYEVVLPRVLQIIQKVASRTVYLELLYENDGALIHLIRLCQQSHWISDYIAKFPILLDELIDPKLLHNPPALADYANELQQAMLRIPEDDVESQMNGLRQFKQAQQLRIAAADISGVLPLMKVSDHLTALAEATIGEVIQQAWHQLTARFGQPKSTLGTNHKGFAVLGYGKMGGIELGYGSDLDLVFVHDCPLNDTTNGEREIAASQFYVKLAQKVMHIFNTRMSSGILYELDMRLRPSGNSGVLVIHIDSFADYQLTEAWTWEHQALVRARMVYGHDDIRDNFSATRKRVLTNPRENGELKKQVVEMREKMRNHIDTSSGQCIDIKHGHGGLVDIEFLTQYLVLRFSGQYPQLTEFSDNIRIIEGLAKVGVVSDESAQHLVDSYCQLRNASHRAVLQDGKAQLSQAMFNQMAGSVAQIWQRFME
ncbi:bifunctional [glutamate--ammonia ligase]-adenylyl-L-tyrosine phosphorylase/[glutamate--ammonia-ligase] adenylyltransferase [Thalassotalea euphylliae]|uniref:Bifunctional glutamine synthetase adenylyltransferase/adenylyl-removing enzyme n=1 Tax=Thalassotalea euphylliae TaxID=1655234 RepID=A0A3E0UIL2_9GAMM|nr:bifunctional [glutamate--ammonia ligase]-adenylyl-L-tyrosine phosphorylase/[glutamate--ammonia-ligase] adenylyltransferase [Thalassotalea euphylliae]REL36473.1 bifunctional [glutamate--ammonia ligase]-adenylyl-L-tyrosine phosphorylase/[glutamate--ammonia-ligase] adenylyltransferase [Thalassotalea euphylliae]